jgi:hypothetical protein
LTVLTELLRPVATMQLPGDLTGGHLVGSEEPGGAVALIVVPAARSDPRSHGQDGLGPVLGLNLRLLVDAEHGGPLGRIKVESDDVPHLLHQEGIGRRV